MTLRRREPDGKTKDATSQLSGSGSPRAILDVRAGLILLGGLVAGIGAGILTFLAVHNLPEAVLAGVPACAATITFLNGFIA
jgi:hypothetical protein